MSVGDLVKRVLLLSLGIGFVIVLGPPAEASDESSAKKLVITKADVGRGFVAQKAGDNSDAFPLVAECVGASIKGRRLTASEQGPELINDSKHSDINSSVDIVKTKAMAKADKAVVASSAFPQCIEQVVEQEGQSSGVESVSSQRATVKEYADYSTAVLSQVTGTRSNGQSATLSVISVYILKGRAEFGAEFITNGTIPYDRKDAEAILDKVVKRLDKAKVS